MRVHKYQAWHKREKKLYRYVELTTYADGSSGVTLLVDTDGYSFTPDEDDVELREFIGIPDKHGKEVYAGDILQNAVGERGYVIHWMEVDERIYGKRTMGYYFQEINTPQARTLTGLRALFPREVVKMEVIGNVYEHPECLAADDYNER